MRTSDHSIAIPFSDNFNQLIRTIGIISLFTGVVPALAADYESPRTAALAGAGHAGPLLNDSVYLNPSYAAFLPTYSVSGNLSTYQGSKATGQSQSDLHGTNFNISVQDGRSELFQAGAGYTRREDANVINIGVARAVTRQIAVGLGGKFLFTRNRASQRVQDAVASGTYLVNEWLQTSVTVDNIVQSPSDKAHNLYREVTVGTKFNLQGMAMLYLDPHYTPDIAGQSRYGWNAAIEFTIFQDVFLRGGTFRNSQIPWLQQRGNGYGVGLGWMAPRVSLDYGWSRAIVPRLAGAHTFGATVYF